MRRAERARSRGRRGARRSPPRCARAQQAAPSSRYAKARDGSMRTALRWCSTASSYAHLLHEPAPSAPPRFVDPGLSAQHARSGRSLPRAPSRHQGDARGCCARLDRWDEARAPARTERRPVEAPCSAGRSEVVVRVGIWGSIRCDGEASAASSSRCARVGRAEVTVGDRRARVGSMLSRQSVSASRLHGGAIPARTASATDEEDASAAAEHGDGRAPLPPRAHEAGTRSRPGGDERMLASTGMVRDEGELHESNRTSRRGREAGDEKPRPPRTALVRGPGERPIAEHDCGRRERIAVLDVRVPIDASAR